MICVVEDVADLWALERTGAFHGRYHVTGGLLSAIFTRDPEDHSNIGVRLGALDGDPGVRPSIRQFVAYAAVWEPIPDDGLPRYPERRPPD